MKLEDIRDMILGADPGAKHYTSGVSGSNFTRWMEYERTGLMADDLRGDGWKFQIDRFTKTEFDPVAEAIERTLVEHEGITFTYMVEYETDTGYIRHIFDCEGT